MFNAFITISRSTLTNAQEQTFIIYRKTTKQTYTQFTFTFNRSHRSIRSATLIQQFNGIFVTLHGHDFF